MTTRWSFSVRLDALDDAQLRRLGEKLRDVALEFGAKNLSVDAEVRKPSPPPEPKAQQGFKHLPDEW